MQFIKATKKQAKGRVALIGVSGSGKTWTSLLWARVFAGESGRIAVIDSESGSASKYADEFEFDKLDLDSFTPRSYIAAIQAAEAAGYDVVIVDSLSHAWAGKDGVLALVDHATARSQSKNAFTSGWREVTPEHNALVDALVRCKCHLIVTMRVKTDYVIEEVNGKKMPRKIGLAPVQRDGLEYEFDLVGDMDSEHKLIVSKSRCRKLADGVFNKPDETQARVFAEWLGAGAPADTPDQITDHEKLIVKVNEALDAKGYDEVRKAQIKDNVCKKHSVAAVSALTDDKLKAFAKAVKDGAFDPKKKPEPAVA